MLFLSFLVLSGLFIYPSAFLLGERNGNDGLFFDVRNYIKYTPPEAAALIEWAVENNIYLNSRNYEYNRQMNIEFFLLDASKTGYLDSSYDQVVKKNIDKVFITELSTDSSSYSDYAEGTLDSLDKVYSNSWGSVYV